MTIWVTCSREWAYCVVPENINNPQGGHLALDPHTPGISIQRGAYQIPPSSPGISVIFKTG